MAPEREDIQMACTILAIFEHGCNPSKCHLALIWCFEE
jgi:hypothetical protein